MNTYCSECGKAVKGKMLKHYRYQHPVLFAWIVQLLDKLPLSKRIDS